MTDESNRNPKPAGPRNPNTGGVNDTATGRGPQRPDNEPQVPTRDAPASAPARPDPAAGATD